MHSKLAPHPFTLRQLQYIVAVADELSFRAAAERCHVAQPSLSTQLAQLEEAIGTQIFERDKRRVLVTAAGRDIIERARRILIEADDLVQAGKRASDPFTGTLRVGVIPTISPYLLPQVAPKLRSKFPDLVIAWREEKTEVVIAALEAGDLDAAIVALESEIGDVENDVIARDAFVVATRPEHPLAKKTSPLVPADLRNTEVLLLDDGHCFRDQALEVCATGRARESEFRATSLSTLVQMVAGGSGVTLLPAISVGTEAKRASLVVRALASPKAYRTIALVWRKHGPLAGALRQVAAVVRDAFPVPAVAHGPTKKKSARSNADEIR